MFCKCAAHLLHRTVELSRRLHTVNPNSIFEFEFIFCHSLGLKNRSVSASCSILTLPYNYLHASESHHSQSYRPSINVSVYRFTVGKENHCLADVFRHNLFRRNEFGRNVDLDAVKHSDGYSITKPQSFSPYCSRPTIGSSTHLFYQPGGCILCFV
jgi:hypothetical protein